MDLATRYLGLELKNPLVASASPLNGKLSNIRALEDAGAGAVVLPSMFEEQLEQEAQRVEELVHERAESFPEALSYFPLSADAHPGPDPYLELVRKAREAVEIPVIASLNGITDQAWTRYAKLLEQAGASAIELNVYFIPSDISLDGRQVEQRYLEVLRAVKKATRLPVSIKLSPYFSAAGQMAAQLDAEGADGLVLFNRFYQPDIDLSRLSMRRDLELSHSGEIRLPLLWIGLLAGRLGCSLGASTGVESGREVIKYLLAGADVVMTTSALLRQGIDYMNVLRDELVQWLEGREMTLAQLRGSMSHASLHSPEVFERANYLQIMDSWGSSHSLS